MKCEKIQEKVPGEHILDKFLTTSLSVRAILSASIKAYEEPMAQFQRRERGVGRISAFLVAIALSLAGFSFGQGRIERGSALAKKIERSKRILIVTPEGEETGRRAVIRDEGIAISLAEPPRAVGSYRSTLVPWDGVWAIKVRKTGARLGTLIGFGGGVILGYALTDYFSWVEDVPDPPAGWLVKGAMVGGAVGALSGFLIGSLFAHWKVLFPARAAGRAVPTISFAPAGHGGLSLSISLSF